MTLDRLRVLYPVLASITQQKESTMEPDTTPEILFNVKVYTEEIIMRPVGLSGPGMLIEVAGAEEVDGVEKVSINVTTFGGIDGFDPGDREGMAYMLDGLAQTLTDGTIKEINLSERN